MTGCNVNRKWHHNKGEGEEVRNQTHLRWKKGGNFKQSRTKQLKQKWSRVRSEMRKRRIITLWWWDEAPRSIDTFSQLCQHMYRHFIRTYIVYGAIMRSTKYTTISFQVMGPNQTKQEMCSWTPSLETWKNLPESVPWCGASGRFARLHHLNTRRSHMSWIFADGSSLDTPGSWMKHLVWAATCHQVRPFTSSTWCSWYIRIMSQKCLCEIIGGENWRWTQIFNLCWALIGSTKAT